ncbi:MAG: DUF2905 domain-containing protein [Chloroflexi bacterium]|nr:DUF2905 domain-containing protein [Chloroflexota bacterium]
MNTVGRWLIGIGLGIALLGSVFLIISRMPGFNQLGNLPGDLRLQSQNGQLTCVVPIVSSIVLSVLATIVLNVVVRVINRP